MVVGRKQAKSESFSSFSRFGTNARSFLVELREFLFSRELGRWEGEKKIGLYMERK